MLAVVFTMTSVPTKYEVPSFIHFKDIMGPQFRNRSHDPDHAHLWVVCQPNAGTLYGLPVYEI